MFAMCNLYICYIVQKIPVYL